MNEWTSTLGAVAGAYVGAVRDELADLPDEVRIDLMEDVVEHVTAVAAEYTDLTMNALVDRVGAPSEYAAQLREAAGLVSIPAPAESGRDGYARRLGRFLTVMFSFGALAMVPLSLWVLDTGLLWAAGILAVAAFMTPDVAVGTKLVYAYISYALLMIPGGCLADRVGARKALAWCGPGEPVPGLVAT